MYAETTNNGNINLMDLDRPSVLAIRDSLQRALNAVQLNEEERQRFAALISKITLECGNFRPGQYDSKL